MKESWRKRWRYGCLYPALSLLPRRLSYNAVYYTRGSGGLVESIDIEMMRKNLIDCLGENIDVDGIIKAHITMRALENLDPYFLDGIPTKYSINDFMEFTNLNVLERALAKGRGVVLLIGHYGRVTMPFVGLGNLGFTVGGVTMRIQENPLIGPLEANHIQNKSDRIERHAGGIFARVGDVSQLKMLYGLLRENGISYLAIDVFNGNQNDVPLPFLGRTSKFPASILRIALKNKSPVVGCFAFQDGRNLVVEFEEAPTPSSSRDYESLAFYVRILERRIIDKPQEWWFWPTLHHIWE